MKVNECDLVKKKVSNKDSKVMSIERQKRPEAFLSTMCVYDKTSERSFRKLIDFRIQSASDIQ